ncbi:leucine-rich repeat-containing protein 24-like protein, partial [Dinothrombium tinctorium]
MRIILSKTSAQSTLLLCEPRTIFMFAILLLLRLNTLVAVKSVISSSASSHANQMCPQNRLYIWKDNKKTVECPNLHLTSIPANIENDVQVFNFSGNPLRALHDRVFYKSGLMNLQRIYLS